jgi:ABC-type Na+ efflux pump permease subunit
MNSTLLIFRKEWKSFLGSDPGLFVTYGFIVAIYSLVFATNSASGLGTVWWIVYAMVINSAFANTVFVAERMTGALEVLLTSGVSRRGILAGKALFAFAMSLALGGLSLALSLVWAALMPRMGAGSTMGWEGPATFAAAAFMTTMSGAWLSVRFASPRVVHLVNIFLSMAMVGSSVALTWTPGALPAVLLGLGCVFWVLAARAFDGERVIQPVQL